jgi:hypothetical protein
VVVKSVQRGSLAEVRPRVGQHASGEPVPVSLEAGSAWQAWDTCSFSFITSGGVRVRTPAFRCWGR